VPLPKFLSRRGISRSTPLFQQIEVTLASVSTTQKWHRGVTLNRDLVPTARYPILCKKEVVDADRKGDETLVCYRNVHCVPDFVHLCGSLLLSGVIEWALNEVGIRGTRQRLSRNRRNNSTRTILQISLGARTPVCSSQTEAMAGHFSVEQRVSPRGLARALATHSQPK
jgi:hypothetical protein